MLERIKQDIENLEKSSENKENQKQKMSIDNEKLAKLNVELNEKVESLVIDVSNSGSKIDELKKIELLKTVNLKRQKKI